jgi:glutamate-5-semialdehyde dehydrogenase
MTELESMGERAKKAARSLSIAGESKKKEALLLAADMLEQQRSKIIEINKTDLEAAAGKLTENFIDRLTLTEDRIALMSEGIRLVAMSPDPIGRIIGGSVRPNGLRIEKVTVPLGVIGIIYESRPNVTGDSAALCLKSSNAVILRGGKESINSNKIISDIIRNAIEAKGLDPNCVQLVTDTTHESAIEMMGLSSYLDVLIPRGSGKLIKAVVENSKVPVIETGVGNCHIYVDESADITMASDIIFNAKTSRPSVCNAAETMLIHSKIAAKALPVIKKHLDEKNVIIYGDSRTREIIPAEIASEEDWYKEYLDYKIACRVVDSIDEAIDHIAHYSSHHSETIVTEDYTNSELFLSVVDSAAVYVNASTRFTDGGEFGLGAEIGISTQKLHARGPMGLEQLTTYKYIIRGNGQIR